MNATLAFDPPPRRWREVALLFLAFAIIGAGYWVVRQAYLPAWRTLMPGPEWQFYLPPALMLLGWLCASAVLHARRCRETLLLPVVALLVGIGLLFLLRLAGGAETLGLMRDIKGVPHSLGAIFLDKYDKQLISFFLGWVVLIYLLLTRHDYRMLSRLKYLIASTAVGLLLITTLFGHDVGGQTLTLRLGPIAFQPHDPVKLLLVIFLAAYLVEKRELIRFAAGRYGLLTLMDLRYMGPLVILWAMVMAIVFIHKDLGAAVLLFGSFLGILYLGTGRKNYIFIGIALFVFGMFFAYTNIQRVRTRVAIWQNPWQDANDKGYQACQALMAMGNGRTIGAGLAGGYPEQVPAIETDMIYAAISEDLGLVGAVFIIALFLVLIGRLFHIGLQAEDPFGSLLAAGLGVTLAVQSWVILAGVTKLIPLTGITLPFISYGGSSLLVNMGLIGLALKVASGKKQT